jgi:WD40 repeat protein
MSQQHEPFEVLLVAPSEAELNESLTQAVNAANARCRNALVQLSPIAREDTVRAMASRPEGTRQKLGGQGGPREAERSAVAVAWWADRLGRRHVRVKGARRKFPHGPDADRNILNPRTESRPPVWMLYPDLIYVTGTGEDQRVLAACPCGMVGDLDAIGWMGDRCAACHDRTEEGQALPDWQRIAPWSLKSGSVSAVSFSPEGNLVGAAACGGASVVVHDLATGETRTREGDRHGYGLPVEQELAFLPDGNLAIGLEQDILILDPHTFDLHRSFKTGISIRRVAWSPGGNLLTVSGPSSDMSVWDLHTGEQRFEVAGRDAQPRPCSSVFTPDGKSLVTGWWGGSIHWWKVPRGTAGPTWTVPGATAALGVVELAIAPDGRTLASLTTAVASNLHLWDTSNGTVLATHTVDRKGYNPHWGMRLLAFSPDGRTLVSSERAGGLKFWDMTSAARPVSLASHPDWEIRTLTFSPDGRWLAVGDQLGTVKLWPWQALLAAARGAG